MKAANSGRERENKLKNAYGYGTPLFTPARCPCCHAPDTIMTSGLKNAASVSNNNQKPAWLISYENTVGGNNNNPIYSHNTDEEGLKQASTQNNSGNSVPNWLISFRNTIGFEL